jgi:hypothetical protein
MLFAGMRTTATSMSGERTEDVSLPPTRFRSDLMAAFSLLAVGHDR